MTATPAILDQPEEIERISRIVRLSPETVKAHILRARQELQSAAPQLVSDAIRAAGVAADKGRVGEIVTLLEKIPEAEGARVVDVQQSGPSGVSINFGAIQLGGLSGAKVGGIIEESLQVVDSKEPTS